MAPQENGIQQILWDKLSDFFRYKEESPLIFTSVEFWIFFLVFLGAFSLTHKNHRLKNPVILVFSLFFYYKSSGWAVFLLLSTITQDYWIARWMELTASRPLRKALITTSVVVNLLVLAYFKYAFLLVDFMNSSFGWNIPKRNWLVQLLPDHDLLSIDSTNILLPVGISFFIFHTLSYTIDVFRGIVKPLRSWVDYAVFVSFFPELVAGPIVRARDFVDQLVAPYSVDRHSFGKGVCLILGGLFKKIVLSDLISTGIVDKVFDQPQLANPVEAWMALYGYGLQIFCDFSGYTDIAIGLALILGYRLKANFDQPYKSVTITEFWRRWHISLSVWLRDYLYIPLGGNRKGNVRTYINLLITMLLGGLWHGASLQFLIWGGLHGSALAIHKFWTGISGKFGKWIPNGLGWFITLHFVLFCWIPFRSGTAEVGWLFFQKLWTVWNPSDLPAIFEQYTLVLGLLVTGFFLHLMPVRYKEMVSNFFEQSPVWRLALLSVLAVVLINQFKTAESQPFIYFQF